MKKNHVYFVCYNYVSEQDNGFGNLEIAFSDGRKIECFKDIKELQDYLNHSTMISNGNAIILNYQLLRIEDVNE